MSRRLEILLHDYLVGYLSETSEGGTEFRFRDSYRNLVPRPVLGQKFEDDLDRTYRSRKGQTLPDFFANLVPEGRLRDLIEETANLEAGDDLALLAFVGEDLPGALIVRPFGDADEAWSFPEETSEPARAEEPSSTNGGLRFLLAGVQLKFSMLREEDKLTLPMKGQGGDWIVKFDSPTYPNLPENELSMLRWAESAGFEVPECHLHSIEDVADFPRRYAPEESRVLAIRRYDRGPEGRVHQEDFAQAVGLPPAKKYEQITYEIMAQLVQRFIDEKAVDELVRRLTFVVACGNNDAHLKNWSFLYLDAIQARWSPLYDQISTVAWKSPDRALALKLAGVKGFGRIDRSTFERFADKARIDRQRVLDLVAETLTRLRDVWREIGPGLPLPEAHRGALRDHWRRVPLLRSAGTLD